VVEQHNQELFHVNRTSYITASNSLSDK